MTEHRQYSTEEIRKGWTAYCHDSLGITRSSVAHDVFNDWLEGLKREWQAEALEALHEDFRTWPTGSGFPIDSAIMQRIQRRTREVRGTDERSDE